MVSPEKHRTLSVDELIDENDLLCKVIVDVNDRLLVAGAKGNSEAEEIYRHSVSLLMPLLEKEDKRMTEQEMIEEMEERRDKKNACGRINHVDLLKEAHRILVNAMEQNDGKIEYARSAWDLIFRIEKELD